MARILSIDSCLARDLLKTIKAENYGLRPRGIKISPDGNFYIATLEHSDNYIVLDKEFNHVKTVDTKHDVSEDNLHKGKSPYGVSFSPSGDKLFVAASGGYKTRSSLEVYDGKTFEKIKRITLPIDAFHLLFISVDNTPLKKSKKKSYGRLVEMGKILSIVDFANTFE